MPKKQVAVDSNVWERLEAVLSKLQESQAPTDPLVKTINENDAEVQTLLEKDTNNPATRHLLDAALQNKKQANMLYRDLAKQQSTPFGVSTAVLEGRDPFAQPIKIPSVTSAAKTTGATPSHPSESSPTVRSPTKRRHASKAYECSACSKKYSGETYNWFTHRDKYHKDASLVPAVKRGKGLQQSDLAVKRMKHLLDNSTSLKHWTPAHKIKW